MTLRNPKRGGKNPSRQSSCRSSITHITWRRPIKENKEMDLLVANDLDLVRIHDWNKIAISWLEVICVHRPSGSITDMRASPSCTYPISTRRRVPVRFPHPILLDPNRVHGNILKTWPKLISSRLGTSHCRGRWADLHVEVVPVWKKGRTWNMRSPFALQSILLRCGMRNRGNTSDFRSYVFPSTAFLIAPNEALRAKSLGRSWRKDTISSALSLPTFSIQ